MILKMKFFFCKSLRQSHDLTKPESKPPEQAYRRLSRIRKHRVISAADDYDHLPPVYQKDFASKLKIKEALCKNEFLQNFDSSHIDAFALAMYLKEFPANTRIIQEGDIGYHLYVSEKGNFDIYQGSTYERSFGPGTAFGELALLYNTKRLRSVDVKNAGKVWVLDRSAFRAVMSIENTPTTSDNVERLRRITLFKTSPNHILAKISELIQVEFFQADSCIISEGEKAKKFYIINGGNVKIIKRNESGEEKIIVLKKEGYFGEQALSDNGENLYQVSAIALAPGVECFTIETKALLNYLGNFALIKKDKWLFGLLRKSISRYDKSMSIYENLKITDLQVKDTLGAGAFGKVELVTIASIADKSFARKKIKKAEAVRMECERYILNEKKIMLYCDSPFICKLYRTFKDNKYVYFLMEVCLGGNLCTYITRNGSLSDTSAKFVMACIVEAIAYLHHHGIVCRDVKPENIMIDNQGYIKLTDFGSSKIIGLERTRSFVGTPEYMAPEIIFNKPYDRAVDYWSLGIVLHELLLGRPPFEDVDSLTLYGKIIKGIDSIGIYGCLKKHAENLIRCLLQLNPADRLGNLAGGIADIRSHKWFGTFDWNALNNCNLTSPIKPKIRNHLDTRHFDRFPLEEDDAENEFSGWDQEF